MKNIKKKAISIGFYNHKGGVGKTSSVVNLAGSFVRRCKKKVLVIDCDPQGNASSVLGLVHPQKQPRTLMDLFSDPASTMSSVIVPTKLDNIDLIACNIDASSMALKMSQNDPLRLMGLRKKLDADTLEKYDYILIDCGPSLDSMFFVNAVTITDYYLIPVEAESGFALAGVEALLDAINSIIQGMDLPTKLMGALVTMYDARTTSSKIIADSTLAFFGKSNVMETYIPRNTAVAKANNAKNTAYFIDPSAGATVAYTSLALEIEKKLSARAK